MKSQQDRKESLRTPSTHSAGTKRPSNSNCAKRIPFLCSLQCAVFFLVWVCWIQFKVVIIIEGLSAWQMPLFIDFFCPNAHEYAVMTRSPQYQYFVIDLRSIILFPLLINTNTNINYFIEGLSISILYRFFHKFCYQFQ